MISRELSEQLRSWEMPLSYCRVDDEMTSLVCFINFYDQIFPRSNTSVDLHLTFFGSDGSLVADVQKTIPPREAVQIDCSEFVSAFEGMVGVTAIPNADLKVLAGDRLVLKKTVGTGYYMIWRSLNGQGIDQSHEWSPLSVKPTGEKTFYVTFVPTHAPLHRGLILMNTCASESAVADPVLIARDSKRNELGRVGLGSLGPCGTQRVDLNEVFGSFDQWLKAGVVTVEVSARNITLPLSVERLAGGDFHIHHV